jgi:hypothetical protein
VFGLLLTNTFGHAFAVEILEGWLGAGAGLGLGLAWGWGWFGAGAGLGLGLVWGCGWLGTENYTSTCFHNQRILYENADVLPHNCYVPRDTCNPLISLEM